MMRFDVDSHGNSENLAKTMNPKEEQQLEYMEVEEVPTDDKQLSASPSFPIFSRFSVESTSAALNSVSSVPFRSTLYRSSHSDINHSNEKCVFEVSKSFGQFTFGQSKSINSKESLSTKHKPLATLTQDSTQEENQDIKPEIEEKIKRNLRPLMRKKAKPIYSCSCWQIIFFLLLPVVVVLISTIFNEQHKFCEPSLNFTNVTEYLPKLVHGQSQGVADLIDLFEESDVLEFKVIALVGGTGVGKSHVANIIKNSLPQSYYIFEYFPPLYNKVRQVYSMLSTCQCNIIILENLGTEDISDAAFFSQALRNRASDLCVVILALFNTQVTDGNLNRNLDLKGSIERIGIGFKKEGIEIKAVGFEPLQEESLIKCISEAIKDSLLKLSEEDVNRVRKSLLAANSGCKGAYSKVQLLGKI